MPTDTDRCPMCEIDVEVKARVDDALKVDHEALAITEADAFRALSDAQTAYRDAEAAVTATTEAPGTPTHDALLEALVDATEAREAAQQAVYTASTARSNADNERKQALRALRVALTPESPPSPPEPTPGG